MSEDSLHAMITCPAADKLTNILYTGSYWDKLAEKQKLHSYYGTVATRHLVKSYLRYNTVSRMISSIETPLFKDWISEKNECLFHGTATEQHYNLMNEFNMLRLTPLSNDERNSLLKVEVSSARNGRRSRAMSFVFRVVKGNVVERPVVNDDFDNWHYHEDKMVMWDVARFAVDRHLANIKRGVVNNA